MTIKTQWKRENAACKEGFVFKPFVWAWVLALQVSSAILKQAFISFVTVSGQSLVTINSSLSSFSDFCPPPLVFTLPNLLLERHTEALHGLQITILNGFFSVVFLLVLLCAHQWHFLLSSYDILSDFDNSALVLFSPNPTSDMLVCPLASCWLPMNIHQLQHACFFISPSLWMLYPCHFPTLNPELMRPNSVTLVQSHGCIPTVCRDVLPGSTINLCNMSKMEWIFLAKKIFLPFYQWVIHCWAFDHPSSILRGITGFFHHTSSGHQVLGFYICNISS